MQNEGLFRGPAGDGFLHQTSKFWSRGPYGGPRWRCSNQVKKSLKWLTTQARFDKNKQKVLRSYCLFPPLREIINSVMAMISFKLPRGTQES
jgi:hypothetical protein